MSVGTADLHKAMVALWNSSNLDDNFTSYWSSSNQLEFPVLNDAEAEPGQPFPYCIFESVPGSVAARMSGNSVGSNYEQRDIPWTFRVQARDHGGAESAKAIAAKLAGKIMEVFGGHPTVASQIDADGLSMDNGNVLQVQYQNDYGSRPDIGSGNEAYSWTVQYRITVDVPVAM